MHRDLFTWLVFCLAVLFTACGGNSDESNVGEGNDGSTLTDCTPGEAGADDYCKQEYGNEPEFLHPENLFCAETLQGGGGTCVECRADADCDDGEKCDGEHCYQYTCTTGTECWRYGSPTAHDACIGGKCGKCEADADCEQGEKCVQFGDGRAELCVVDEELDTSCADGTCQAASDTRCEARLNDSRRVVGIECVTIDDGADAG